jgi:hypothetical protein
MNRIIVTFNQVIRFPIQEHFNLYQQPFKHVKFRMVRFLKVTFCFHMVLQANTDHDSNVHYGRNLRHPAYLYIFILTVLLYFSDRFHPFYRPGRTLGRVEVWFYSVF